MNKLVTLVINNSHESYSVPVSSQFTAEFALLDNYKHELEVEDKLPVARLEHALEAYYAGMSTLLSSCYADLAPLFRQMMPRNTQKYAYLFGLRDELDIKKLHVANYIGEMLEKDHNYKGPCVRVLPYFFDRIERCDKVRRVVSAIMWYHEAKDLNDVRWEPYQEVLKLATSVESQGCVLASESLVAPLAKSVLRQQTSESTLDSVMLVCFKRYLDITSTTITGSVEQGLRMFKDLFTPVQEQLEDNVASCAKYYVKRLITAKSRAGYSHSMEDVVEIVLEEADHSCKILLHDLVRSVACWCEEIRPLVDAL